jgi:hypothetical protein
MGLLGLFFNKTVLKVIFFIVIAFLLLQILAWFLSFSLGLGLVPLVCLVAATLILSKYAAMRDSHLGSLLGSVMFLLFSFLSFVLILEILVPVQITYPLSVPIKLGLASLPSVLYLAHQRNVRPPKAFSFFSKKLRHNSRISPSDLLPKGVEEGHIAYGAGSRGFRVLRFLEVKQRVDQEENSSTGRQIRRQIAVTLTRQLKTMRRLGVGFSYEVHCRGGVPRVFVASICEGRDYGTCRSVVDECSNLLTRSLGSIGSAAISTRSLDECDKAKKALTLPIFTSTEEVTQIKNADYTIELFRSKNSEKPVRLRMINLRDIRSLCLKDKFGLIDELIEIALTHRPILDFTAILNIKPLQESNIEQELMEVSWKDVASLAQFSEELRKEFQTEHKKAKKYSYAEDRLSLIQQEGQNAHLNAVRLMKAKKSGYFQVNVTLISEPATIESIARKIRCRTSHDSADAKPSIDRIPPPLLTKTIRRYPLLTSEKLTGDELISLVQLPRSLAEFQRDLSVERTAKLADVQQLIHTTPNATSP